MASALYTIVADKVDGRFAICNGRFDCQLLANRARELFPELAKAGVIPLGDPKNTPSASGSYLLDGSKAERELGIKCMSWFPGKMVKLMSPRRCTRHHDLGYCSAAERDRGNPSLTTNIYMHA